MQLGTKHIAPGAVLAPMAGVTDLAFRTICAEHGASMTVSEMVSSGRWSIRIRRAWGS